MTLRCLFVGRPSPHKGLSILLEAMEKMPEKTIHLTVVGGIHPNERERLNGLKSDNIRCLGPLNQKHISELMRTCDILVVPSLYESFGNVALEGMASGLPVIASRCGGLQELVADGRCGILVEPGQPENLAEALLRLCQDQGLRERMGRLGVQRSQQFHWSLICEKTMQILGQTHE